MFAKQSIKKIHSRYFHNDHIATISKTQLSFLINIGIACIKLLIGICFDSKWLMVTGSYYFMLAIARGHVLYRFNKLQTNSTKEMEHKVAFRVYHHSGYFICALGLSYLFLCIWMYQFNEQIVYPSYILYGVVAIAFYKIGMAIYGLRNKKMHRLPLVSVLKILNFIDACVSIVAIQCALLVSQHSAQASESSAMLGMVIAVACIIIGLYMVKKKDKRVDNH